MILFCSECNERIGKEAIYFDYLGNPLCDNCMVTNDNGQVCPSCGLKYPHHLMNSGFCEKCYEEKDL